MSGDCWAVFLWRLENPRYPSGADVLWMLLYPGADVAMYREAVALSRSRQALLLDIALGTAGTLLALAVLVDARVDAWAARLLAAAAIVLAAVQMGVAVNDTTSLSRSHEMAVTDELTGLRNRRGSFDEAVRRRNEPAALVLLDLDRFKEVNDTFGHASGDALLRVVARRPAEASREHLGSDPDVVARLGGDEFAVRLAADTEAQALEADARMVDAVCSRYDVDGVRVSIDHYGTGYSTLGYLRDLSLDELKIDRTFVRGMADDARSRTIVESTVDRRPSTVDRRPSTVDRRPSPSPTALVSGSSRRVWRPSRTRTRRALPAATRIASMARGADLAQHSGHPERLRSRPWTSRCSERRGTSAARSAPS